MILNAFNYGYFKQVKVFRKNKIVFLNGCFDLLHVGHIRLIKRALTYAKNNNAKLIVGLNSDKSFEKLNKQHPLINSESNRAQTLLELGADYVVIFDEKTPSALIMSLTPDVVFKGIEYIDKDFHEKEYLIGTNTTIIWDDFIQDLSSTNIYNKIEEQVKAKIRESI